MASVPVSVYVFGYGRLRVISKDEYFSEDWQYEGEDDFSGYTVCYSCELDDYACVRLWEEN